MIDYKKTHGSSPVRWVNRSGKAELKQEGKMDNCNKNHNKISKHVLSEIYVFRKENNI